MLVYTAPSKMIIRHNQTRRNHEVVIKVATKSGNILAIDGKYVSWCVDLDTLKGWILKSAIYPERIKFKLSPHKAYKL